MGKYPIGFETARTLGGTLVWIAVMLALSGCSAIHKQLSILPGISDPSKIAVRSVALQARADANQDSATELDFVFLLDATLVDSLPATAPQWFDNKKLLMSNLSEKMMVSSVGLAPGTSAVLLMPKGYKKAEDLIVYANYLSAKGQKWYRLPNVKNVQLLLTQIDVELTDADK